MREYKFYKTIKKTCKENNLEISNRNGNYLFDFSFLDNLEIPQEVKDTIKEETKNHVDSAFNEVLTYHSLNKFDTYDIRVLYRWKNIYKDNGCKLAYKLFVFKEYDIKYFERKSIYDDHNMIWEKKSENEDLKRCYPNILSDLEI